MIMSPEMKIIFSALIMGAAIIIAAVLLKPEPAADPVYKQPETCIFHKDDRIIYKLCP